MDHSFILRMSADAPTPVPLGLSGYPTTDAAGEPISYYRMRLATCGDWTHCGTGEALPITRERVDEWLKNTKALSAAGRQPFASTKHTFSNPDAKDTLGSVVDAERVGDELFVTVAFHGTESPKIAARNGRSVGVADNGMDAKGNSYQGEFIHHVAFVPNPALPGLGGMAKVAASAAGGQPPTTIDVPMYELRLRNPTPAAGRKGSNMNAELRPKIRAALSLGADVPDDQLDDRAGNAVLTLIGERDAAKADAQAKAAEVLALAADGPAKIDPLAMALVGKAFATEEKQLIASGALSEAGVVELRKLYYSDGKPTRAALALAAGSTEPLYSRVIEIMRKFPGTRAGHEVDRPPHGAEPAFAASAGGGDPKLTDAEKAQKAVKDAVQKTIDSRYKGTADAMGANGNGHK